MESKTIKSGKSEFLSTEKARRAQVFHRKLVFIGKFRQAFSELLNGINYREYVLCRKYVLNATNLTNLRSIIYFTCNFLFICEYENIA